MAHIICNANNLDLCFRLEGMGVEWDCDDIEEMSPLFYAIKSENMEMLKFLIMVKKVDIEKKDV